MDTKSQFISQQPSNNFLSTLVDEFFYLDINTSELAMKNEPIIPFPRITFGYFFEHPFTVVNHTLGQTATFNIGISRISTDQISVEPATDRIRIVGAHAKPYFLAYLTKNPIHTMPWPVHTEENFSNIAANFKKKIDTCETPEEMFSEIENFLLENILTRDLSIIAAAVELIEKNEGKIRLHNLSQQLSVSERTIRNQFSDHIGCSPKEYIRLVRLKQVVYDMKNSSDSLTSIAYENDYFDQAHFVHELKNITGKVPNDLRKKIPDFRFLQF
ncbi:AraC family transcriptional regulator [Chryseobacterium sediminis]|uniref:helix-turn-helix domain-containing protein n=1 Tax=Chryseobacterium sediminis TaxID=1679494 RepID=UPI00285EF15B|nr:AraC family transcriptional regulator [Chryseobacterium sediminis]MDR6464565.1 AraC-like DNA-binding protein [Chryseobacterium sediminis]